MGTVKLRFLQDINDPKNPIKKGQILDVKYEGHQQYVLSGAAKYVIHGQINTKPIMIPKRLQNSEYRFCFVNCKIPYEKNWPIDVYKYDDKRLSNRLQQGKSYGIVCGYGNLMMVDADTQMVFDAFSKYPTFTVKTGNPTGHHLYYDVPGLRKSRAFSNNKKDNIGHITSKGRMVVGPNCPHYKEIGRKDYNATNPKHSSVLGKYFEATGKTYTVVEDIPIRTLTEKEYLAAMAQLDAKKRDETNLITAPIQNVVDVWLKEHPNWLSKSKEGYRGHNPDHPNSKSRMDLTIDVKKNWWICSACCNSGYGFGNTLYLIALFEGILHCHECKAGGLRGEKIKKVKKLAIEKYGINPDVFKNSKPHTTKLSLPIMNGNKQIATLVDFSGYKLKIIDKDGKIIFPPTVTKKVWYTNQYYRKQIAKAFIEKCELSKSQATDMTNTVCVEVGKKISNRKKKEEEKKAENSVTTEKTIIENCIDETVTVVLTTDGIYSIDTRAEESENWITYKVFSGSFKPIEKMIIDDDHVIRYSINGVENVSTFRGLFNQMRAQGGVVSRLRVEDTVNGICLDLSTSMGHATYGVYDKNGKLELCLDPIAIKDDQRNAEIIGKDATKTVMTKETLKPYTKIPAFWHQYEVLPSMGMGVMAPFALMLRRDMKLICNLFHYSPLPKLGKTTVLSVYSWLLFHIQPMSGDSIGSTFRFSSKIDSICGLMLVDECENINWKDIIDLAKESPANYVCSVRGTPDQQINRFLSRAVFGFTSNRLGITNKTFLLRNIFINFDNTLTSKRGGNAKCVDELKEVMDQLKPIGWQIVEAELEDLEYSTSNLFKRLDEHGKELKKKCKSFSDPRRVDSYALIYEGLQCWERVFKKYDLEWASPTYADFITNVVDKIEKATVELEESPVADFFHWFEMWRVRNTVVSFDRDGFERKIVKGENEIWANKNLKYAKNQSGFVITDAVIREYRADKQSQIDTLADMTRVIVQLTGWPREEINKGWDIGGKTNWSLFIPSNICQYKDKKDKADDNVKDEEDDGIGYDAGKNIDITKLM